MRKIGIVIGLIGLVCIIGLSWLYLNRQVFFQNQGLQPGESKVLSSLPPASNSSTTPTAQSVPYQIEVVAEDLMIPWSLIFTDNNRILVSERSGQIRVVEAGQLMQQPLIDIEEVSPLAEAGLMGLALDPDYQTNKNFYACYAYRSANGLKDKIVKLQDQGTTAEVVSTLLDNIPAAQFHAGCRLKIGPDKFLYATTGDATNKQLAQDLDSLGGKILRLNLDGTIPADNPFPNSYVYSYGHRNSQGLDWHPETQDLLATEHGPSGNDGPGGGDEVNVIDPGENYGWPLVSHQRSQPGLVDPLIVFTPAEAPASGMFYSGRVFPQFKHDYFFGALRGQGIIRLELVESDPRQLISYEKLSISVGRIRDVVESPDGLIYFTTSNMDGRGDPRPGDDKIYRLVPTQ